MIKLQIKKPRKLNSFRALLRIFRLNKMLEESWAREKGAWRNRDVFCNHINIIGKDVLKFQSDNCAPEAVSREIKNLVARLEDEIKDLKFQIEEMNK